MTSMQCHKPANYETCQQKCHKPANETCQQQQQHSSLGQKVSEIASFLKGGHHGQHNNSSSHSTTTQCYTQANTSCKPLPQANCGNGQHGLGQHNMHHGTNNNNNGMACQQGKTKTKKKRADGRNLFQKIKDGISGDSSCSDSSDSDSDHEGGCRKNKN